MKKRTIKIISALFILSLLFQVSMAQNSINKNYNWNNESEELELTVDVKPNAKEISIEVEGEVSKGNLIVTAYNPDGKKETGFCLITDCSLQCKGKNKSKIKASARDRSKNKNYSVSSNTENGVSTVSVSSSDAGYSYACSSSNDSSGAKGNMHEVWSDPMPGKWTFTIEVVEVTGEMDIEVRQK